MTKLETLLFDKGGAEHTEATLEAARKRTVELGIKTVVMATTTGETALKAADIFAATDVRLIGVTLQAGTWEKYGKPDFEKLQAARDRGVTIITATHTLMGNIATAVREQLGGMPSTEVISHTYYTFCQGMKVAVEVLLMAADAGLLEDENEVLAVAGTGSGADTAIVASKVYSTTFFNLKIHEILAMPRNPSEH